MSPRKVAVPRPEWMGMIEQQIGSSGPWIVSLPTGGPVPGTDDKRYDQLWVAECHVGSFRSPKSYSAWSLDHGVLQVAQWDRGRKTVKRSDVLGDILLGHDSPEEADRFAVLCEFLIRKRGRHALKPFLMSDDRDTREQAARLAGILFGQQAGGAE